MEIITIMVLFCFWYVKVSGHYLYGHSQDLGVPVTMLRPISLDNSDMYYYYDYDSYDQENEQGKRGGNQPNTTKDTSTKSSIIPGAVMPVKLVNNEYKRTIVDETRRTSTSPPRSSQRSVTTPPNQAMTGKILQSLPEEAKAYMRTLFRLVRQRISRYKQMSKITFSNNFIV